MSLKGIVFLYFLSILCFLKFLYIFVILEKNKLKFLRICDFEIPKLIIKNLKKEK